jgi:hypothetical protein
MSGMTRLATRSGSETAAEVGYTDWNLADRTVEA